MMSGGGDVNKYLVWYSVWITLFYNKKKMYRETLCYKYSICSIFYHQVSLGISLKIENEEDEFPNFGGFRASEFVMKLFL